jgi:hypothetical protein
MEVHHLQAMEVHHLQAMEVLHQVAMETAMETLKVTWIPVEEIMITITITIGLAFLLPTLVAVKVASMESVRTASVGRNQSRNPSLWPLMILNMFAIALIFGILIAL